MNQERCNPDMTEEHTWYSTPNGEFRVRKTRFGLHISYDRDGNELVTGLTLDSVVQMTPWHMFWEIYGYTPPEGQENIVYDGVVGGKL